MKRYTFFLIFWAVIVLVNSCEQVSAPPTTMEQLPASTSETISAKEKYKNTVRVVLGGDVMLARDVEQTIQDFGNGDYAFPFKYVADYMRQADIAFVNLENVMSNMGAVFTGKLMPYFRVRPEAVEGLKVAGIDIVSVANNHIFDYGREGMEDTFNNLTRENITYVGGGFSHEEAYSPVIFTVNSGNGDSVRIAFLAFNAIGMKASFAVPGENGAPGTSGIAWCTHEYAMPAIAAAKKKADILIVSAHFGIEYEEIPTSQLQLDFGYAAIEKGADIVVGHHPHVAQPIILFNDKYIAWSLGNLVFDQPFPITLKGMLLEVVIEDKEIVAVNRKTYTINETFQPVFDPADSGE